MASSKSIKPEDVKELLAILKKRFEENVNRHEDLDWQKIQVKLESDLEKLRTLEKMELSGGQPDVVAYDKKRNQYLFFDCVTESPAARRSLCYDRPALDSRKANKPQSSALDVAKEIGIEILNEEQYMQLQKLGSFDTKTSSWIATPSEIRELGGAIFGDRRFGKVFIYHNGADSYYAARGFRGFLWV